MYVVIILQQLYLVCNVSYKVVCAMCVSRILLMLVYGHVNFLNSGCCHYLS
jgi:hypothetical protein